LNHWCKKNELMNEEIIIVEEIEDDKKEKNHDNTLYYIMVDIIGIYVSFLIIGIINEKM
jgi:hypothetical protein